MEQMGWEYRKTMAEFLSLYCTVCRRKIQRGPEGNGWYTERRRVYCPECWEERTK